LRPLFLVIFRAAPARRLYNGAFLVFAGEAFKLQMFKKIVKIKGAG